MYLQLGGYDLGLLNVSGCSCLNWKVAGTWGQVTAKRTNVPGMKGFRGPYIPGYRPRRPYGYVLYDSGFASVVDSIFLLVCIFCIECKVCVLLIIYV